MSCSNVEDPRVLARETCITRRLIIHIELNRVNVIVLAFLLEAWAKRQTVIRL